MPRRQETNVCVYVCVCWVGVGGVVCVGGGVEAAAWVAKPDVTRMLLERVSKT